MSPIESPREACGIYFRIEQAWLKLIERRRRAPIAVYLTDSGVIAGIDYDAKGGTLIGYYDHRVELRDFRADVEDVYRKVRGGG